MLTSYRLSIEQCGKLSDESTFWSVLQEEATPVDSVATGPPGLLDAVFDFIGTERRVPIPSGRETDFGAPLRPPTGWRVTSFLTKHDSHVLGTRMQKRGVDASAAAHVCECYGFTDAESVPTAGCIIQFLERQPNHLPADEYRLLLVASESRAQKMDEAAQE